jgi:thioredoxin-dependent peroxiredoxin
MSFDTPEENKSFADKFNFPFPLLSDEERKVGLQYGACDSLDAGYPKRIAYLIDEKGRVQEAHPKVDAKSYPKEQLKSL